MCVAEWTDWLRFLLTNQSSGLTSLSLDFIICEIPVIIVQGFQDPVRSYAWEGILKTSPWLIGSLGVSSTQNAVILTVILYYSKKYRLKSAKAQARWTKSSINQVQVSKCLVSRITWIHLISQQWCVRNRANCCQPGKLTWALVSIVLIRG